MRFFRLAIALEILIVQAYSVPGVIVIESIYLAMFTDQRGIITDNFKLILCPEAGASELYNMETDRWERKDISGNPEYQSILRIGSANCKNGNL